MRGKETIRNCPPHLSLAAFFSAKGGHEGVAPGVIPHNNIGHVIRCGRGQAIGLQNAHQALISRRWPVPGLVEGCQGLLGGMAECFKEFPGLV